MGTRRRVELVLLAACGAWATCRDSAPYNCTDLVRERGCDACCLPDHQSVRTACPASCGLCAAPASGPSYDAEHQALVILYDATAGSTWTRRDRWLDVGGSHCFWFGVNCGEEGNVTRLDLPDNSLSGTVPVQLASLSQLTSLDLSINHRVSGTVPVQLASLSQLAELYLRTNRLSGTVPAELASLSQLTWLYLFTNRLSGTVPAELASLGNLNELMLNNNTLSGTVPAELASLGNLTLLDLINTTLSGTVPAELASLGNLTLLGLDNNTLSGTVPTELASLTQLTWLTLHENRLSGTVPAELASLTKLTHLMLDTNRLSGTLPVELASLANLAILELSINGLSGAVPAELASLTKLTHLLLANNRLSGTVPTELALSLQALMIHTNHLSGSLASFTNHSRLRALTLFGNSIGGRLRLPHHAPDLQVVLVHRNRLSCQVKYSSSYNLSVQLSEQNNYRTGALIAPGNRLSVAGKPSWALMSGVHFQWVPDDLWHEWQTELLVAAAGIVGGAAVVGAVLKAEWRSFFQFRPRGLYERYSLLCVWLLLALGGCGLALMPVYISGSGEFECGQLWLKATLAYLSGSPASEQAAAVLICVMLAVQAFVAVAVRFWSPPDLEVDGTGLKGSLSWQRWLALVLLWPPIMLVLSLPAFLAVLADSVPGDQNTLGLSQTMLDVFGLAAAPLLTVIDCLLVPAAARALVGKGAPRRVIGLIVFAQFTILLVVPFVTALVFGSDCYGLWIELWEPCRSDGSFNMAYILPDQVADGYTVSYQDPAWAGASGVALVAHDEVCGVPTAYGRCPRYVIESLAKLLMSKLAFSAFLSPLLAVLLCLPGVKKAKAWLMKTVLRRSECTGTYCLYLDIELAQALSLLTGSIVLGIAVPQLTLLACFAVATRLAAVHLMTSRLGVQFKEEHNRPPRWWYLPVALAFGAGLVLWFFVSNAARIHGEMIILIGAPLAVAVGGAASWGFFRLISKPERPVADADSDGINFSAPAPGQEHVQFANPNAPLEIQFVVGCVRARVN